MRMFEILKALILTLLDVFGYVIRILLPFNYSKMTDERPGSTNTRCPSYKGVR